MKFSAATGRVAMVGGIGGFLLSIFLPVWGKAILGVGMLVAAFVLTRRQGQSLTTVLFSILPIMLLLGAIALIMKAAPALADDGGWKEAGGTFSTWIKSQGAITAMLMGIWPAIGTMLGPAILGALASIGVNIQGPNWMTENNIGDIYSKTSPDMDKSGDIYPNRDKDEVYRNMDKVGDIYANRDKDEIYRNMDKSGDIYPNRDKDEIYRNLDKSGDKEIPNWMTENKFGNAAVDYLGKSFKDHVTDNDRLVDLVLEATTKQSYSVSSEATPLNKTELAAISKLGEATGVDNPLNKGEADAGKAPGGQTDIGKTTGENKIEADIGKATVDNPLNKGEVNAGKTPGGQVDIGKTTGENKTEADIGKATVDNPLNKGGADAGKAPGGQVDIGKTTGENKTEADIGKATVDNPLNQGGADAGKAPGGQVDIGKTTGENKTEADIGKATVDNPLNQGGADAGKAPGGQVDIGESNGENKTEAEYRKSNS